jgi:hypothetical protein
MSMGFSDGLGREISLPFSVTGRPLPVFASSPALTPVGEGAYAYTLEFNGSTTFSPGASTPTFLIDLGALFTSPNEAYVPDTFPSFFFGEATVPSFVTIFDRGQGRYALQIVGGIFPAQGVNKRPDGSLIENTQPFIVQVGDTLGSSGIDLHLVLNIQGHTPRMSEPFAISGVTGQRLKEDYPDTVTGTDRFGFETNTDLLDTCNEVQGAPEWLSPRCHQVVGTVPPNSVGTTTFQLRPRTFIPGTGQLVGVGDWQTATFTNPGQPYARPLGELVPAGTSPRLKVGVAASVALHSPSEIFRWRYLPLFHPLSGLGRGSLQ